MNQVLELLSKEPVNADALRLFFTEGDVNEIKACIIEEFISQSTRHWNPSVRFCPEQYVKDLRSRAGE